MPRYPLFGINQKGKSPRFTAQRRLNLFGEFQPEGDRTKLAFYGTPGATLHANFGDTPIRGMHVMGGVLYVVHRGTLYGIDSLGAATSRGTLDTTSGRVDMEDNGTQLIIVDGSTTGYLYTPGTTTFADITDSDFPGADTVAFESGYFIVNKPETGQFYISGSYDGDSWDALEFATAESFPDKLLAVHVDHNELILFGEDSTEAWTNVGAVDFPYLRIQNAAIEWGLAARWTVAKMDNTIMYLGRSRMGEVQVVRLQGYIPEPITDVEVEAAINGYSTTSDATALAYRSQGHPFYQLNFPTEGKSWLFDGQTGLWSEVGYDEARHPAEIAAVIDKQVYVSDATNGRIYKLDPNAYTWNGETIPRELITRHVFAEQYQSISRLWLDMEMGLGNESGSDPRIMMQRSDDAGHTFGHERLASLGKIGEYKKRPIWRRVGRAFDFTFRFRITDPVKVAIMGGWLEGS